MVLLILGCFTICWLPYFIVACSQIYRLIENSSAVAYMAAFTLAMSNSAMNPLIYAWKNSNFRNAFINLLKCKSPDTLEPSQSMRSNLHRKSSSAQHQDGLSGAFPHYSTPPFMQRKIEPISAMGITFEEDEDKISTHETIPTKSSLNGNCITSTSGNPPQVTIKIESDMKNSIIISTTTLPTLQDDDTSIRNSDTRAQSETIHHDMAEVGDSGTLKTGNLIVNKLMENYGFESSGEDVQRFKENYLNLNGASMIDGSSKYKSKSANSIAITKSPNKSNSHGSIFDHSNSKMKMHQKTNDSMLDTNSEGNKSLSKSNLFPSFNFGRKYISKSFNSSTPVEHVNKTNGSCEGVCRKSTDMNFHA